MGEPYFNCPVQVTSTQEIKMNNSELKQILDAISEKLAKIMELLENSAFSGANYQ
ncbi:MAG: hypothetical protein IKC94_01280 [Lentisphaeria bacterium]|nr:hypothetical protein [Lentisphaeria bacterium]